MRRPEIRTLTRSPCRFAARCRVFLGLGISVLECGSETVTHRRPVGQGSLITSHLCVGFLSRTQLPDNPALLAVQSSVSPIPCKTLSQRIPSCYSALCSLLRSLELLPRPARKLLTVPFSSFSKSFRINTCGLACKC